MLIKSALIDNCTHIAFLDADDEWLPEHMWESMSLLNHCDLVYGSPILFNNETDNLVTFGIPVPKFFIGKHLEHNNFIWISSVVAKASCFKENEFDSDLDGLEDWDMWYRLYKKGYTFKDQNKKTFRYFCSPVGEASKSNIKLEPLRKKHGFNLNQLNLNLACGLDYQQGYINSDLYPPTGAMVDAIIDVAKLPYNDNTVDIIRALHVIEHFTFHESTEVMKEWYRVLKPGGKLIIETPDFLNSCDAFVKADEQKRIRLYGHFFAFPWEKGQTHKFLFTETQLVTQLTWAGFKNFKRIAPISNYVQPDIVDIFLAMEAFK